MIQTERCLLFVVVDDHKFCRFCGGHSFLSKQTTANSFVLHYLRLFVFCIYKTCLNLNIFRVVHSFSHHILSTVHIFSPSRVDLTNGNAMFAQVCSLFKWVWLKWPTTHESELWLCVIKVIDKTQQHDELIPATWYRLYNNFIVMQIISYICTWFRCEGSLLNVLHNAFPVNFQYWTFHISYFTDGLFILDYMPTPTTHTIRDSMYATTNCCWEMIRWFVALKMKYWLEV